MDRSTGKLATVFGGSGFVGTQIVQHLAKAGYRVRVAVRRPDLAGHVKMYGTVGQILPIQANVRNEPSVARAVVGADLVINLVAIGDEAGKQTFDAVNAEGARVVARAARQAGASALVHMSALGVDKVETSDYARSKLAGETAVFEEFAEATIMRPSLIFGPGDGFFNLMGTLSRYFPVMPLIHGDTRFQPVYVGDVADAFVAAGTGAIRTGRIYELGGPEVVTHKELLERILRHVERNRPLLPLSPGIARLLAMPMAILPFPALITADKIELLGVDNVVSDAAIAEDRTLEGIGIAPTAMETILPGYMWRFRKNGQFDRRGNDEHRASTGTTV
jgi:NADH dehydrogenase